VRKYISILFWGLLLLSCSTNVFAAGGGFYVGDDSPETLFTGSVSSHYLILSSNGVVSAWGANSFGQCGAEPCDEITEINYIDFENKIVKVSAGNGFSIALDENNTVWGWGKNTDFQLGISRPTDVSGAPTYFTTPQKVSENINDIATGENFNVLLTTDGDVLLSGNGQSNTLKRINPDNTNFKYVTANYDNIIAVDEDNIIHHWKSNGRVFDVIEIEEVDSVQKVSVGKEHLAIKCLKDNSTEIYTYGDNSKYQLGTGNNEPSATPVKVLSLPNEENNYVNVYSGEYNTVVESYNNMSFSDHLTEYVWGTDCCLLEDEDELCFSEPYQSSVYYQLIDVNDGKYVAFDYVTNSIVVFGNEIHKKTIPILEPAEELKPMYKYQYDGLDYHTYNVNFIKLIENAFVVDENADNYEYWEFVNENQFRVKIKDFTSGTGKQMLSSLKLSKDTTGENRVVGTYGPSIWNFNIGNEVFETEIKEIDHGNEDGTEIIVSASTLRNREEVPLNIPNDIEIFYENPGEITENSKLGLYLYGLPKGTAGVITDISDNTFKITLSGNSTVDMDFDSVVKLCYIRAESEQTNCDVVGEFNLNEATVFAGERQLKGLSIKSTENTPETLTVSGTLTKGKENGKVINVSISGGTFADLLYTDAWAIIGEDEISINTVERVDDNNVKITLSGNCTDKYTNSELKVSCEGSQYSDSRVYDEYTGKYIESELLSENRVVLTKQSRSTGGSVSSALSNPTSSVKSGEVAKGTKIELLSTINNSKIYYTTDGTQPTDKSILYQEPIEITDATTIKFIAVSGSSKSAVQTVTYTVKSAEISLKKNAEKIAYIEANGDKFYPDEAMNRYEVLSALNNLFDIENLNIDSSFTDIDDEYLSLVNLFVGAGIIEGYTDNTFRGDSGITRAELVKILSIMLDITESEADAFADASGHWCAGYINGFTELELLHGYPDDTFKPDNIITKAEVITILNRVIKINIDDMKYLTFDDLSEKHWAYRDICAAIIHK